MGSKDEEQRRFNASAPFCFSILVAGASFVEAFMPIQLCLDLLAPLSASVSPVESTQTGGNSQRVPTLSDAVPDDIRLMPYDDAHWQSLLESAEERGRRE